MVDFNNRGIRSSSITPARAESENTARDFEVAASTSDMTSCWIENDLVMPTDETREKVKGIIEGVRRRKEVGEYAIVLTESNQFPCLELSSNSNIVVKIVMGDKSIIDAHLSKSAENVFCLKIDDPIVSQSILERILEVQARIVDESTYKNSVEKACSPRGIPEGLSSEKVGYADLDPNMFYKDAGHLSFKIHDMSPKMKYVFSLTLDAPNTRNE